MSTDTNTEFHAQNIYSMSILDIKRFSCTRNVPNIPNSTQTVFILPFYTKLQASIRSPSTSSLISLLPLPSTLMNMKASLYTQTYLHQTHTYQTLSNFHPRCSRHLHTRQQYYCFSYSCHGQPQYYCSARRYSSSACEPP